MQLIDGRHWLEFEVPRITLDSVTLCSIVVGLREFYRWRMLIHQIPADQLGSRVLCVLACRWTEYCTTMAARPIGAANIRSAWRRVAFPEIGMKKVHGFLLVLASVLSLILEPARLEAQAPKFDAFFVFGDSLSDTGNLWLLTKAAGQDPAVPPSVSPHTTYFNGRFSNGPVAFEYLWDLMNSKAGVSVTPFLSRLKVPQKGAVSFAFGPSGTGFIEPAGPLFVPGLNGQVELFGTALRGKKSPPRALYAIFSGANDYLAASADNPPVPPVVVGNIVKAIQKLYALGARDVMVLNLPDLGLIPLVPAGPLKETMSQLTLAHNYLLDQALNALAASLPDLRLIPVDVYTFTNGLAAQQGTDLTPALSFPDSYCLFTAPATCPNVGTFDVDPNFFFWDAEHPTTATHAALGDFLYSKLVQ